MTFVQTTATTEFGGFSLVLFERSLKEQLDNSQETSQFYTFILFAFWVNFMRSKASRIYRLFETKNRRPVNLQNKKHLWAGPYRSNP